MDYQRLNHADLRVMADTTLAIPMLTAAAQGAHRQGPKLAATVKARTAATAAKTKARRAKWAEQAKEDWDASPITLPRLASEVWNAIKGEDWVLTAGTLEDWTRKLWDFDKPLPPSGQLARHRDADRHLARRGARAPRRRSAWSSTCSPTAT